MLAKNPGPGTHSGSSVMDYLAHSQAVFPNPAVVVLSDPGIGPGEMHRHLNIGIIYSIRLEAAQMSLSSA